MKKKFILFSWKYLWTKYSNLGKILGNILFFLIRGKNVNLCCFCNTTLIFRLILMQKECICKRDLHLGIKYTDLSRETFAVFLVDRFAVHKCSFVDKSLCCTDHLRNCSKIASYTFVEIGDTNCAKYGANSNILSLRLFHFRLFYVDNRMYFDEKLNSVN